jgi:predicted Zn finger-like uncharacterized protein
MIIQCGTCGTKYRFNEALIGEEGAWVRCSKCRRVFFQEKPSGTAESVPGLERKAETAGGVTAESLMAGTRESSREAADAGTAGGRPASKRILVAAVFLLIAIVAFFWFLPQTGKRVLESLPGWSLVADSLGIEKSKRPGDGGVDLLDVREDFIKNWLGGDMMVIHGTAVNRYSHPVAKIRVKAKLLDTQGRFVGETESYCGHVYSNDDLAKMTKKEILEKVAGPAGRNIPGAGVAPSGKVPFVLIFTDPPRNAVEYVVEMVSVAPGGTK